MLAETTFIGGMGRFMIWAQRVTRVPTKMDPDSDNAKVCEVMLRRDYEGIQVCMPTM